MDSKFTKDSDRLFSKSYSTSPKYRNPILANFVSLPGEEVKQEIKTILDKEDALKKEIVNVEDKLTSLGNKYRDLYIKRRSLEEPFEFYERACRDIRERSKEIMDNIFSALIRRKTTTEDITITVGTGYGDSHGLFGLFHLLLSSYNIELESVTTNGQGEQYIHWEFKIPISYTQPTLALLEDNPKFNEIAVAFDKALALSYKKAEEKIAADLSQLDQDLIQPILQGNSKAFTLFKPCPVARERFLEIAENHNICLAIQDAVIVASNKTINLGAKL